MLVFGSGEPLGELTNFTLSDCENYVSARTSADLWVNVWSRLNKHGRATARGVWFARVVPELRRPPSEEREPPSEERGRRQRPEPVRTYRRSQSVTVRLNMPGTPVHGWPNRPPLAFLV